MDDTRPHFGEFVTSQLVPLHRLRVLVAEDDAERKAIKDAFEAEHAGKWANMKLRKDALDMMESGVKADALALYKTIPNATKTLIPGCTIQERKVYTYEPTAALEWAKKTGIALQLNVVDYKKQLDAGSGAPGRVYLEPTVAITRDLTPFIHPAEDGAAQFDAMTPAEREAIPRTEDF